MHALWKYSVDKEDIRFYWKESKCISKFRHNKNKITTQIKGRRPRLFTASAETFDYWRIYVLVKSVIKKLYTEEGTPSGTFQWLRTKNRDSSHESADVRNLVSTIIGVNRNEEHNKHHEIWLKAPSIILRKCSRIRKWTWICGNAYSTLRYAFETWYIVVNSIKWM